MSSSLQAETLDIINELNIKTVLVETKDKQETLPSVTIDNVKAAEEATDYLIKNGAKSIAFVGAKKESLNAWVDRYFGYEKSLNTNGLTIDEDLVFNKGLKVSTGYEAVQKFEASQKTYDAVMCASDEIAMGVINALREHGKRIPEDVSVIGFNDNAVSSVFYPKITTVKQPSYDMGSVAMRMLIKILNNKPIDEPQFVLDYQIIKRDSSK